MDDSLHEPKRIKRDEPASSDGLLSLPCELLRHIVNVGGLTGMDVIYLSHTCCRLYRQQLALLKALHAKEMLRLAFSLFQSGRGQALAAHLVRNGVFSPTLLIEHSHQLLVFANEHLTRVLMDLLVHSGISAADARARPNILRTACDYGYLDVVKYLFEEAGLAVDDAKVDKMAPSRLAAYHGHLDIVKYLFESVGLTAEDCRLQRSLELYSACYTGHVCIVKYLFETVGLTAEDARANGNAALGTACQHGQRDVVEYLIEAVGLTAADVADPVSGPLRCACYNGHLDLVRYLIESTGLTANEVRATQPAALPAACEGGHLPIVKYLIETVGLTAQDTHINGEPPDMTTAIAEYLGQH